VSALILDAGAFIAIERNDRAMVARLRVAEQTGLELRSNGSVVAQVWRDPSGRQASVARLLNATDVRAVDLGVGREAGLLAGRAETSDAIDASVVAIASVGDQIVTSDPDDIRALVRASGRMIRVVPC
jgi:hypothetical protein